MRIPYSLRNILYVAAFLIGIWLSHLIFFPVPYLIEQGQYLPAISSVLSGGLVTIFPVLVVRGLYQAYVSGLETVHQILPSKPYFGR